MLFQTNCSRFLPTICWEPVGVAFGCVDTSLSGEINSSKAFQNIFKTRVDALRSVSGRLV